MKKFWFLAVAMAVAVLQPAQAAVDSYTQTRYPIVLVHGLFGFDNALGVDYFYKITSELQRSGAQVYVAHVSSVEGNEQRGEQLLEQVQRIMAQTGAQKVNLIGHSQGAPTVRYVASVRPDLVASVTSVGGPNKGSAVADVVRGVLPPGSVSESLAVSITGAFGQLINLVSGGGALSQTPLNALSSLTTPGMQAFNQRNPAGVPATACGEGAYRVDNVHYFSWSGASNITNLLDPGDTSLAVLGLAFGQPNDGLVSSCSSHLGQVIRDNYRMNHFDEVNQVLGIVHLFETNPVTLYRQHANRLRNLGV